MADQTRNTEMNKLALRSGVILGIISVVLSIVFYIIDPMMPYTSLWVQFGTMVLIIVLLVVMAQDIRRKTGGFWTFGEAFKSLMMMSLILVLFSIAYNFILVKFIDPEIPQKANDAALEALSSRLSGMGVEQSRIDEATKSMENGEVRDKLLPTFKNMISNLGIGLLIYAIINLIIAAIIKKNPPVFIAVEEADEV